MSKYKKDFYFGAASSAFQMEGAANLDGRTDSVWDDFTKENYFIPEPGVPGREINLIHTACDFYHNYKEDIQLMKKQGLRMFRFSVSWSRVFPNNEFEVNKKGMEFYQDLVNELLMNGIEPIVTLYHWDLPMWAEKRGGWLSKEIYTWFENYSKAMFEGLGSKVKYWLTHNEMLCFSKLSYVIGFFPPLVKDDHTAALKVVHNAHVVSAIAIREYKKMREAGLVKSDGIIGITHNGGPMFFPFDSSDSDDIEATKHLTLMEYDLYWDPSFKGEYPQGIFDLINKFNIDVEITDEEKLIIKENTAEFIGWNYYFVEYVKKTADWNTDKIFTWTQAHMPEGVKATKWNWIIDSKKFGEGLIDIYKRYNLPIIITENGYGDFDQEIDGKIQDPDRIDYIKEHLLGCELALENNVDLFGYLPWTFFDIFSPSGGYRKRYGFVKIDFDKEDLPREEKLSYYWYQAVIENNGDLSKIDNKELLERLYK